MEARLDFQDQGVQAEVTAPVEEKTNWGRFLMDIVETVILAVVLFVGINAVSARVRGWV